MLLKPCLGVKAHVYCDDNGHVYVDGVKMNDALIDQIWRSIIPRNARLIAIEAENTGGGKRIFAYFLNGFTTSTKWRCSTQFTEGWTTVEFDDQNVGWDDAIIIPGTVAIWEKGYNDGTVYCRGHIGKIDN